VIGTGPSLTLVADAIRDAAHANKAWLFGINNTYKDFPLKCWIACDPAWHDHYGQVRGDFDKWHWSEGVCDEFGYRHIEGRWFDGLSTEAHWISYGHSSGWQALNLAVHYGCDPILLVGYDMTYEPGKPRHYFSDLSEQAGEYPVDLRKWSAFDKGGQGLLNDYKHIARQCERGEIPPIYNCTPGSAMQWFPMKTVEEFL